MTIGISRRAFLSGGLGAGLVGLGGCVLLGNDDQNNRQDVLPDTLDLPRTIKGRYANALDRTNGSTTIDNRRLFKDDPLVKSYEIPVGDRVFQGFIPRGEHAYWDKISVPSKKGYDYGLTLKEPPGVFSIWMPGNNDVIEKKYDIFVESEDLAFEDVIPIVDSDLDNGDKASVNGFPGPGIPDIRLSPVFEEDEDGGITSHVIAHFNQKCWDYIQRLNSEPSWGGEAPIRDIFPVSYGDIEPQQIYENEYVDAVSFSNGFRSVSFGGSNINVVSITA